MKRIALALICVLTMLAIAGCATVNSDNSFQNETATAVPVVVQQTETQQPAMDVPQPTDAPTEEPGYNG